MFPDQKIVDDLRAQYPEGCRICLDSMGDDPRPIPAGTKGRVVSVDDIGTVHCNFDNGRRLGLISGVDAFHKITETYVVDICETNRATIEVEASSLEEAEKLATEEFLGGKYQDYGFEVEARIKEEGLNDER